MKNKVKIEIEGEQITPKTIREVLELHFPNCKISVKGIQLQVTQDLYDDKKIQYNNLVIGMAENLFEDEKKDIFNFGRIEPF